MKKIQFESRAGQDVAGIAFHYHSIGSSIAQKFFNELKTALTFIRKFPDAGTEVESGVRKLILKKFPYSIFYRQAEKSIIIIAVLHQRRRPEYWKGRML